MRSNFIKTDGHVTDQFAELMVKLASAYASMSGKLPEAMIRVYAQGLGDLTYEQVRAAMGQLIRDSAFWPTIADIRRVALGNREDGAILAWAGLRRAAAEVGSWASLTCEDGAVAVALDAIGLSWPEFCALEEGPEMHVRRQEFLAAYRAVRLRAPERRVLLGLTGNGHGVSYRLLADGAVAVETGQALTTRAR